MSIANNDKGVGVSLSNKILDIIYLGPVNGTHKHRMGLSGVAAGDFPAANALIKRVY
jgi:hypothetical protein